MNLRGQIGAAPEQTVGGVFRNPWPLDSFGFVVQPDPDLAPMSQLRKGGWQSAALQ